MKIMIETEMTEMPKGCGECSELLRAFSSYGCGAGGAHYKEFVKPESRPDWCPLREVEDEPT